MSTNVFFNNFASSQEQTLIEDLTIESIRVYGHDVWYCPRTIEAKDDIYGEDTISTYNTSYFVEMYIKSFDSYEGDGTFLSKFNLEIRDQMRFQIAMRTFNNEVGAYENIDRPQEGDLIYSPMMKRIFVVMYVSDKPIFYQMGALQMYELTCEVFEYSSERLNTGVPEIDAIEDKYSFNEGSFGVLTNDGSLISDESGEDIYQGQFEFDEQNQDVFSDNNEFEEEDEENNIIDWASLNPLIDPL